jgi:hypothetical protein
MELTQIGVFGGRIKMARRYWRMNESMGYAGTDSYQDVDAIDYFGISQEELDELGDEKIEEMLAKDAWENAIEKVEAWAEPIDQDEAEL